MESFAAARRHRPLHIAPTALVALALFAGQAAHAQIVGAPVEVSAFVQEALNPGQILFEKTQTGVDTSTPPKQRAEILHLAEKGQNLSRRSTNITGAFASALAESDGNGGVGVTAWIGGSPSDTNGAAIGQLVSRATWKQSFTYNGTIPASISMHLKIPAVEVGLIGVAPERDSVSKTETAEAKATLTATIIHPNSTTSPGGTFEFGLRTVEQQLLIGPGLFRNFADIAFIGINDKTLSLFDSFKDNGDASNPRFSVNAVSTNVKLDTLQPGDTMSYVYQLTAQGTTHGFEHGYMAFLGDPFGLDVTLGNLILSTSVPEPAIWMLSMIGLGCIVVVSRRRAARQADLSPP